MGAPDVPLKGIKQKLDLLVNQYKVPKDEARRTVFNQYARDLKLQQPRRAAIRRRVKNQGHHEGRHVGLAEGQGRPALGE